VPFAKEKKKGRKERKKERKKEKELDEVKSWASVFNKRDPFIKKYGLY
jgi:hypothetical protein